MADEEPLSWMFELYDSFSGPVFGIVKALGQFDSAIKAAAGGAARAEGALGRAGGASDRAAEGHKKQRKEVAALEMELGKLSRAGASINLDKLFEGFKGGAFAGIGTLGISEAGSFLVESGAKFLELVKAAAEKALEIGKEIIGAAAKAERLGVSLEILAGKRGADQLGEDMGKLQKATPFDDDALAGAARPLLMAGMKAGTKQLNDILTAGSDVAVAMGAGIEKVNEVVEAIRAVQAKHGIRAKQVAGMNIDVKQFYDDLGHAIGVDPATAEKMASEGKVKREILHQLLLNAIAKMQGGELGIASEKGAATVEARLQKLRDLPEQYFKAMAKSGGFSSLSDFLGRVLEKLDPDGPAGQKIIAFLDRITTNILGMLDTVGDGSALDDLVDGVMGFLGAVSATVPVVQAFVGQARVLFGWVMSLWRGFLGVADAIERWSGMMSLAKRARGEMAAELDRKTADIAPRAAGVNAARGMADGLLGGKPDVERAARGNANAVEEATRDELQIESPSKVFKDLGAMTAEGFAEGMREGRGRVEAAADETTASPRSARPRGEVSVTIINEINVDASGSAASAEEIAEAVKRRLDEPPGSLGAVLEQLAFEQGGA